MSKLTTFRTLTRILPGSAVSPLGVPEVALSYPTAPSPALSQSTLLSPLPTPRTLLRQQHDIAGPAAASLADSIDGRHPELVGSRCRQSCQSDVTGLRGHVGQLGGPRVAQLWSRAGHHTWGRGRGKGLGVSMSEVRDSQSVRGEVRIGTG